VATPIGNLKDITFRAVEVLKIVDLILCEDTRQTRILLNHYAIKTPTLSYHQHSRDNKVAQIVKLLEEGKNLALVADAGTPGIADPGEKLVAELLKKFGAEIKIVPIPGASTIITLASVSGLPCDEFLFLGFLPHKKGRQTLIKEIIASERTVILYEAKYRIVKLLEQLTEYGIGEERPIVVGRELTKKFETIYRGSIQEVLEKVKNDPVKGEYVVMVEKK